MFSSLSLLESLAIQNTNRLRDTEREQRVGEGTTWEGESGREGEPDAFQFLLSEGEGEKKKKNYCFYFWFLFYRILVLYK